MAQNKDIRWHSMAVDKQQRAQRFSQKPIIIWLTGLSGSGKSTTADFLERSLFQQGYHTYLLDGDNVRHGLCQDLGFNAEDRAENIRRVGEVAKLMLDAGLIVITSFISPFRAERDMVRAMVNDQEFLECYVETPLDICEQRDPKGLYKKARAGEIKHFTGIDSPYEIPQNPELKINTAQASEQENAETIMAYLRQHQIIKS